MSVNSFITFFRVLQLDDPVAAGVALLDVLQVEQCDGASTCQCRFQERSDFVSYVLCDEVKGRCEPRSYLRDHVHDGRYVGLSLLSSPITGELHRAMEQGIQASIRGQFYISSLSIALGISDVLDWSFTENDCVDVSYRSYANVTFYGSNHPGDPERFCSEFFELPFMRLLQSKIESALGPVSHAAWWES